MDEVEFLRMNQSVKKKGVPYLTVRSYVREFLFAEVRHMTTSDDAGQIRKVPLHASPFDREFLFDEVRGI